ncbi:MAG TPA: transporter substrate-binding domain-containing protein [Burkholderiaceae bacterium]|nr:transporter substrate-binding domain-containing protein [Burkholderiaceae bacterium]
MNPARPARTTASASPARPRRGLPGALTALALMLAAGAQAAPTMLRTAAQEGVAAKFAPATAARPGFCIELFRRIEHIEPELHITGEKRTIPLRRIELMLAGGELDLFCGLLRTPKRMERLVFLDPPLLPIQHRALVRRDDPIDVPNLAAIAALGPDNLVMTTQGTALEATLRSHGITVDDSTIRMDLVLEKLLAQRGRFFYQSDLNLDALLSNNPKAAQVRWLPAVFHREDQYMVLGPHVSAITRERLTRALTRLAREGELTRLYERYRPRPDAAGAAPKKG